MIHIHFPLVNIEYLDITIRVANFGGQVVCLVNNQDTLVSPFKPVEMFRYTEFHVNNDILVTATDETLTRTEVVLYQGDTTLYRATITLGTEYPQGFILVETERDPSIKTRFFHLDKDHYLDLVAYIEHKNTRVEVFSNKNHDMRFKVFDEKVEVTPSLEGHLEVPVEGVPVMEDYLAITADTIVEASLVESHAWFNLEQNPDSDDGYGGNVFKGSISWMEVEDHNPPQLTIATETKSAYVTVKLLK